MCCRYWTDESPEIREIVEEMNKSLLLSKWHATTGITTYGEIRPTNVVPVIASNRSGAGSVFPMKWGFTSRALLMNARTETAPTKATFRDAWASHRCIVPASWYFEWEHITGNDGKKRTGDKYLIQPKGQRDDLDVRAIQNREQYAGVRHPHTRSGRRNPLHP